MADLNLTADFTDLQQLQKIIDQLGPTFGKTVARLQRENKQLESAFNASATVIKRAIDETVGAKAQAQYKAFEAVQKRRNQLSQEYERIAQKQALADQKITQEMLRQRDAAEELARTKAQNFQSQIGGNLGLGAQGISAAGSADAYAAEIERLRLKFDQVYASSQLYERSLNELNAAHRLGAISTQQHEKAVESLNMEYQQFQNAPERAGESINRFTRAANQGRLRMSSMGMVVQQTGYQVGDFLVQVQGGTNWMVAFGQQATQLAGLLSTFPKFTVLGAGLGIAIPLATALGAAWMRTREAQDEATESAKRLTAAYKDLSDATYNAQVELDKLRFGVDEQYQVELLREQVRLRDENTAKLAEYNNYVATTTDSLDRQKIVTAEMLEVLQSQVTAFNDIQSKLDRQEQLSATLALNERVRQAAAETTARLIKEIADREAERVAIGERIYAGMLAVQGAHQKTHEFTKLLREEMEKAGISTVKLSNTDIASGIWGGAAAALALADRLGIALTNAQGLSGIANYEASGGPDEARRSNALTMGKEGGTLASGAGGVFKDTSGGGGGGEDPFVSRFEQLQEFLKSETELEIDAYNERQNTLQTALDRKMITLQQYNDMEKQLKQDHNAAMEELDVYRYGSGLAQAEQFFGGMAEAFNSGNEKMQKAGQVFAGIEATINAYRAFNQVLADQSLPWFAKIPAAVGVLAAGMKTVAAIKGGGKGGVGSVGGSAGRATSTVAPAAQAPTPQSVYIDSINPSDLYSGQTLINLFDALYDENDKRGKVFVVGR